MHMRISWSEAMAAPEVPAALMPATQVPTAVVSMPAVVSVAVAWLP
jgi:hypothetical protein